jgi:hypothetical protein
MSQKIVDRDLLPRRRSIRHVLADQILDLQFAALFKQQNTRSGELLRQRAKPELR